MRSAAGFHRTAGVIARTEKARLPTASLDDLMSVLRKFGIGAEAVSIDERAGPVFAIKPVAFNRDQATSRRAAMSRIASSYSNVTVARGFVTARLT